MQAPSSIGVQTQDSTSAIHLHPSPGSLGVVQVGWPESLGGLLSRQMGGCPGGGRMPKPGEVVQAGWSKLAGGHGQKVLSTLCSPLPRQHQCVVPMVAILPGPSQLLGSQDPNSWGILPPFFPNTLLPSVLGRAPKSWVVTFMMTSAETLVSYEVCQKFWDSGGDTFRGTILWPHHTWDFGKDTCFVKKILACGLLPCDLV